MQLTGRSLHLRSRFGSCAPWQTIQPSTRHSSRINQLCYALPEGNPFSKSTPLSVATPVDDTVPQQQNWSSCVSKHVWDYDGNKIAYVVSLCLVAYVLFTLHA